MPLVRVQVKNEFGLGKPELYKEADNEDPKAVLDGVAVAGLVGILRQLGDLAQFAGEVFHGLQEQVMITASRSHNVMARVKQIESALPSLEKAILAQTSHIHFAYTAGSEWHPRVQTEQNHFIYHDLPRFILDSYEECRDPPQLHLLDKFDTGGPGSCLKRYSDPTFFKRTSTSGKISLEKVRSDKKAHKVKRKRSMVRNGEVRHGASIPNHNSSLQFTSISNEGASFSQIATFDMLMKSDAGNSSKKIYSGPGSGDAGSVLKLGSSLQTKEPEFRESSSSSLMQFSDVVDSIVPGEQSKMVDDKFQRALEDQIDSSFSSHVTWDEKAEIVKPRNQQDIREKTEILQSIGQQDVKKLAEIVQLRTQLDAREMTESVQPKTQKNVTELVEIVQPKSQQEFRGTEEIVQPSFQQGVQEMTEILQPMTQKGVREMAEILERRSRHNAREMIEIVQPRTRKSGREMTEMVQPRSRQDVREMKEKMQPRAQQDAREMEEIVQPRSQQDVTGMTEVAQPRIPKGAREMEEDLQPRNEKDVREMVQPGPPQGVREMPEIVQCWTQQDVREMPEIGMVRTQQGGMEKEEMAEPGSQNRDNVEIGEQRSQQHDNDEEFKVPVPESTLDPYEMEGFYQRNDEQMSTLANNSHVFESIYGGNVFEEIESETDNYMDALNTIESESETDLDCQTKREVEPCSSDIKCEVVDPLHDLLESSLDPDIPISSNEPQKPFDKGMISSLPNLVCSDSFYHDQRLENTIEVSSPDCPLVTNLHGKESPTSESDVSDSFPPDSTSSLEDQSRIELLNRVPESEKGAFSYNPSDKFWTNGGLLGLQPSKPPSWAVSNAACEDTSKGKKLGRSEHAYVIDGNAQEMKVDILPKDAYNIEKDSTSNKSSLHHYVSGKIHGNCTPFQELSRGDLNVKNENFSINPSSNGSTCVHVNDVVNTNVVAAGITSSALPNVRTQTMEEGEESNQNFGHQLLVNGFHRKLTLIHDDRFETTDGPGKRNPYQDTVSQTLYERTFKEDLVCDSSIDSCPPSPPLDHMKISFHPVSSFEISKLKLRFPDGSEGRGNTKDIFPSFQLVPEESISVHEVGSESDDDTFCRSSPCMSDDGLSDHSKSNSDLWESDDAIESTSKSSFDLHASQMESLSASFELDGSTKNGITVDDESGKLNTRRGTDESLSGPLLDLPYFDIMNPVMSERITDNHTPAPPPPPPAQWRVSKTSLDVPIEQRDLSAHSKQVKSTVVVQQMTHEPVASKPNGKKPEQMTKDVKKKPNHNGNGKVMDAREDFLQQIREKSFNLRRTVTEKPSTTTGPATHVKVTAILEKANAIRQAVGSDYGEDDDSWSDA